MTTTNGTPPRPAPEPQATASGHRPARPATPAPDVPAWLATATPSQVKTASRAVLALLADHRHLLSQPLTDGLYELNDLLSEWLCPYPTAQLDARVAKLNEQFPNYEHWYVRYGSTVTWSSRKKEPPA